VSKSYAELESSDGASYGDVKRCWDAEEARAQGSPDDVEEHLLTTFSEDKAPQSLPRCSLARKQHVRLHMR
jgi:hypothetical protein